MLTLVIVLTIALAALVGLYRIGRWIGRTLEQLSRELDELADEITGKGKDQ